MQEKTSDVWVAVSPWKKKKKGNYRIPKIKIKPIRVSCFMGALSQRKHLVLALLGRTCGALCRDVTHGGQRGCRGRISYLKRASHLSRSYKNPCCWERSPLCFYPQAAEVGRVGEQDKSAPAALGFLLLGKFLKQMIQFAEGWSQKAFMRVMIGNRHLAALSRH